MFSTKCPKCGEEMYSITKEQDYWVCHCGTVVTVEAEGKREANKIILKAMKENGEQYIHVKSKKSGSKSQKGRSDKKAKMQRPSTTQLYNRLAGG